MTNKDKIMGYLKDKGWVNKGKICRDIVESSVTPVYHDTIGRALRTLKEEGKIHKRPEGRGTAYRVNEEYIGKSMDLSERVNRKMEIRKSKIIPTLFD